MAKKRVIERQIKTGLIGEMLEETLGLTPDEMRRVLRHQLEQFDRHLETVHRLINDGVITLDTTINLGRSSRPLGEVLDELQTMRQQVEQARSGKTALTDDQRKQERDFSFLANDMFKAVSQMEGLDETQLGVHPKAFGLPKTGRVVADELKLRSSTSVEAVEGLKHLGFAEQYVAAIDGKKVDTERLRELTSGNRPQIPLPLQNGAIDKREFQPVFAGAEEQALKPEAVAHSLKMMMSLLQQSEQHGHLEEVSRNRFVRQALKEAPGIVNDAKRWLAEEIAADKGMKDSNINIRKTINNEIKGASGGGFLDSFPQWMQNVANGIGAVVDTLVIRPATWVMSHIPGVKNLLPNHDMPQTDKLLLGVAAVTLQELQLSQQERSDNSKWMTREDATTILNWLNEQAHILGIEDFGAQMTKMAKDARLIRSTKQVDDAVTQSLVNAVAPPHS